MAQTIAAPNPFSRRQQAAATESVWRWIEPALVWSPGLVLVLRLLFLLVGSFSARWDSRGLSGLSLSAYAEAFALGAQDIVFSFSLGLGVTLTNLLIGVPLAYFLTTFRFRGRGLALELVALPVLLPAMILSMGLILGFPALLGTWVILFLAHLAWTLPFMVWPVMTALRSFGAGSVTAAARTLGASDWQVFGLVVLPNLRSAAVLGAALVFTISFAEINGSLFLASGNYRPVGVGLFETFMNLELRVAAAYTMLFILALVPPLSVFVLLRK